MGTILECRDYYIMPIAEEIGEGNCEVEGTDNTPEWHNCVFIQNYIFNSSSAFGRLLSLQLLCNDTGML